MNTKGIIIFTIVIALMISLDFYLWKAFRATTSTAVFNFVKWLIPLSTLGLFIGFLNLITKTIHSSQSSAFMNVLLAISLGIFVTKIIISCVFFIEDFYRIGNWLVQKIGNQSNQNITFESRRNFVKNTSLIIGGLPFIGSVYAATKGKYNYHRKKLKLKFDRFPASFNGFKIVQFSDFHAGSFDDIEKVRRGLEIINQHHPDLILFTGDLVNNRAWEATPFQEMFKNLSAKYGKFAILGNHDYGDYLPFENEAERKENLNSIENFFQNADFKLLKNENHIIDNGQDQIHLIGVENWGTGHFPQYGDIDKALQSVENKPFKVLMSHDPDHWEFVIRKMDTMIDLTLSGHTHGAQLGVDIPGWKWSPVKYRYKRWLGLYQENDRYLFVSKGFGFLGYPGRLGMWPEIVVFELSNPNY